MLCRNVRILRQAPSGDFIVICPLAMIVSVLMAGWSVGQTTQPSTQEKLEGLLGEVRKVLPPAYVAQLSPVENSPINRRPDVPMLRVVSKQPMLTRDVSPGMPEETPRTMERMFVSWTMHRYVTPAEWTRRSAENDLKVARRIELDRRLRQENVKSIGHKGPEPFPPSIYRPETEAHHRLVLEYHILWQETELHVLPTHYYNGLAFEIFDSRWWHAPVDEDQHNEFELIMAKVQLFLRPYKSTIVNLPGK